MQRSAPAPSPKKALLILAAAIVAALLALPAGASAARPADDLSRWIKQVSKPAKYGKVKLPRKFKRALPAVNRAGAKLLAKAEGANFRPRAARLRGGRRAIAAGGPGAVVDTMTIKGPTINAGGGVQITSTGEARAYADGSVDMKITVEAKSGKDRVRFSPVVDVKQTTPETPCPTADGTIALEHSQTFGGTMVAMRGRRVVGAVTDRSTTSVRIRGQVGRDARLQDVKADVKLKVEHFERGLQNVNEVSGTIIAPREGAATVDGTLTAKVKIRAAGATAAQERTLERQTAAAIAGSADVKKALGDTAAVYRDQILRDEHKWYDIPNQCAQIDYDPQPVASLSPGASATVKGVVRAADGGESGGDFTVSAVAHGSFAASKPAADPGDPALFNATGATPAGDDFTVSAELIATSHAGRATRDWYARGGGLVDVTFTGHATYTRDEGTDASDIEHHVFADYEWTTTYENVDLAAGAAMVNFAKSSTVTGSWSDDGRFGAEGPGSYTCIGTVKGYNGEFSMLFAEPASGGVKLKAGAFVAAQADYAATGCTGLPSPPYSSFAMSGSYEAQKAVLTIDPTQLGTGPIVRSVSPTAQLAADCSDLVGTHEPPCTQALSWTGTVTVKQAAG